MSRGDGVWGRGVSDDTAPLTSPTKRIVTGWGGVVITVAFLWHIQMNGVCGIGSRLLVIACCAVKRENLHN